MYLSVKGLWFQPFTYALGVNTLTFLHGKLPTNIPPPNIPPFHLCIKASGRLYFYFYFSMLQTSVEVNDVKGSCI